MAKDLKNTRDYVLTKHIPDLFEVRSLLILLCIFLNTYKYFGNFGSRYTIRTRIAFNPMCTFCVRDKPSCDLEIRYPLPFNEVSLQSRSMKNQT